MARRRLAALWTAALWTASFWTASPCAAQQAQPSRLALDTTAAMDQTVDGAGNATTGITLDAVASYDLGNGFEAIVRPFIQRLGATGEWNRQIWVAAMRYEHHGPIGVRVDAGLIPSPIGLSNLLLRPQLNPTISLPSALFTGLPAVELRAPRTTLLTAIYGYGASATISGTRWDARVAAIDTSPVRARRIFGPVNPPQFPTMTVGGGVTPIVGVRVGASITRTGWQKAGESPTIVVDRAATQVTIESEVSFRYTKLMSEWVRDALDTSLGTRVASGWWLQGQQTLAPRWFAAGRVERIGAPLATALGTTDQHLASVEETLGFRLTPELTFRVSHRARRVFGRPTFDNQVAGSIVWWRRWR